MRHLAQATKVGQHVGELVAWVAAVPADMPEVDLAYTSSGLELCSCDSGQNMVGHGPGLELRQAHCLPAIRGGGQCLGGRTPPRAEQGQHCGHCRERDRWR